LGEQDRVKQTLLSDMVLEHLRDVTKARTLWIDSELSYERIQARLQGIQDSEDHTVVFEQVSDSRLWGDILQLIQDGCAVWAGISARHAHHSVGPADAMAAFEQVVRLHRASLCGDAAPALALWERIDNPQFIELGTDEPDGSDSGFATVDWSPLSQKEVSMHRPYSA
jgi:hypothetical protein